MKKVCSYYFYCVSWRSYKLYWDWSVYNVWRDFCYFYVMIRLYIYMRSFSVRSRAVFYCES